MLRWPTGNALVKHTFGSMRMDPTRKKDKITLKDAYGKRRASIPFLARCFHCLCHLKDLIVQRDNLLHFQIVCCLRKWNNLMSINFFFSDKKVLGQKPVSSRYLCILLEGREHFEEEAVNKESSGLAPDRSLRQILKGIIHNA
ncbi:uncharacterized protein [Primulina huaijiensis]|uniref:uncharacterized protein isoform X2 n=1 Tax=Primulina huaijiensis TaxID=1492673 RepID=UPI003CC6EF2F